MAHLYRCTNCHLDFPNDIKYNRCPYCNMFNQQIWDAKDGEPMSKDEAEYHYNHGKFENFMKERGDKDTDEEFNEKVEQLVKNDLKRLQEERKTRSEFDQVIEEGMFSLQDKELFSSLESKL